MILPFKCNVPLLLAREKDTDYPRAFQQRLNVAADVVAERDKNSLLVVTVDAADNSVLAARSCVPAEKSFVRDLVNLGDLKRNVRLIVTTRTGRISDLHLPRRFGLIDIKEFDEDETRAYVSQSFQNVPTPWIDDFQYFSHGNPRVQSYAIAYGKGNLDRTLDYLRPHGKHLGDVFEQLYDEALHKAGLVGSEDNFSAALVALPRPIPEQDLANISGLNVAQVRDMCLDLCTRRPNCRRKSRLCG